ncbi:islet cell autoantigen 1-like [Styela clava]
MDIYMDPSLSTVNKMQREYWTAKQVLKKKLGKVEDRHVVAGDNDIDAKLSLYGSIVGTCDKLLKELETYHACICALARDENQLGRFLKDQGSQDKTQAGKMMSAVGKALCFSAQQRLLLRHPLGRLREDVETFRQRAITDTDMSVKKMEEERTHYRASLMWMQDISGKLDPEQYKKLEKFRKVQNEVRINKEKFDRLKWGVCQKIDLLCASRSNLFSNTLVPYQDEMISFWDKTAKSMSSVLESFDGYQHYEFKLLKDLNPIQIPDSSGDEAKLSKSGKNEEKDDEKGADLLINLNAQDTGGNGVDDDLLNPFEDALEALDLGGAESSKKADDGPSISELLGDFNETGKESKEEMDLWNDLIGGDQDQKGEFEKQWQSAFGDFESASAPPNEPTLEQLEKDMLDLIKPGEKPQQPNQNETAKGFLPSQLMDMGFGQYTGLPSGLPHGMMFPGGIPPVPGAVSANQQQLYFQQQPQPQMQMIHGMPNTGNFMSNQPAHYTGSMFNSGQMNQGATSNMSTAPASRMPEKNMKGDPSKGNKTAWYNLFSELDPLQNPDSLGRKEEEKANDDGRAC